MNIEVLKYCEIDAQASRSYSAIHNVPIEKNLGDICGVDLDTLPIGFTLLTHGSPCTSFSNAGLRLGGDRGSGTPSSLMWNSVEIIRHCKPKFVIWENVSSVLSKKHKHNFDAYLTKMSELGYRNYYQVLNSKDYGIPQNRERVFTISILDGNEFEFPNGIKCDNEIKVVGNYMPSGHEAGRIVDENGISPTIKENHGTVTAVIQGFEFPPKQELKLKLIDVLEDEVDEKYYLSDDQISRIQTSTYVQTQRRIQKKEYCDTLCARDWKDPKCVEVEEKVGLYDHTSSDNFAKGKRDYGYRNEYGTLKCNPKYSIYKNTDLRIRKLIPLECWRLMGFDDETFEKASRVNSNTQLYKQAGNSIVVNVLEAIIKNLPM